MPQPRNYNSVFYLRGSGPSARALGRALRELGYDGPAVNFGVANTSHGWHTYLNHLINHPRHVWPAANKRIALGTMRARGVPVPSFTDDYAVAQSWTHNGATVIGRPDHHRAGSGWWWCEDPDDVRISEEAGATHWLDHIPNTREFRVHIAFGKSIKLTEKLYFPTEAQFQAANPAEHGRIRSHANGWKHMHPLEGAHRTTLRAIAKQAVQALNLDFGAVDILTSQGSNPHHVLEVNTAPNLTAHTDTCQRYANAIHNHNQEA